MDKRHLHHLWTRFRRLKPWYFLIICVLFVGLSVYELRQNNLHMVTLRNTVYTADKNNGDINGTLKDLQAYVTAHMNTNLSSGPNGAYPPIQLEYTYERLQEAATQQISAANEQIYTDAEDYCQKQIPNGYYGLYRLSCVEPYVASHGLKVANNIPASLYEFNFLSPRWSPDLAGWSLVATVLAFILFVATWLTDRWFKHRVE